MTAEEKRAFENLRLKFTSGNDCEVSRAVITLEEYRTVLGYIAKLEKRNTDAGWALENFHQEQRDNFHGDGQW